MHMKPSFVTIAVGATETKSEVSSLIYKINTAAATAKPGLFTHPLKADGRTD